MTENLHHWIQQAERDLLSPITLDAKKSTGFLYTEAKDITIDPQSRVVTFKSPINARGQDTFEDRNTYEQYYRDQVANVVAPSFHDENTLFNGEQQVLPEAFHPLMGGRPVLTHVHVYESAEDGKQYISMPIVSHGILSGQAKLGGSNMIQGSKLPKIGFAKKTAQQKESPHFLETNKQEGQQLITTPENFDLGFWNIQFADQKGGFSKIKGCHIQRAADGTFEVFSADKQIIYEGFDDAFSIKEQISFDRINTIVDLDTIKQANEGDWIPIKKLFWANNIFSNISDLPKDKQHLFKQEGEQILYQYKATPPLALFLDMERRHIRTQSITPQIVHSVSQKIGSLFEDNIGKTLELPQWKKEKIQVPKDLSQIENKAKNISTEFYEWLLEKKGKQLTCDADFGTAEALVECKKQAEGDEKQKDQIFRMMAYQLIQGLSINITIYSLQEPKNPINLPGVKYEVFTPNDPRIVQLQNYLNTKIEEDK